MRMEAVLRIMGLELPAVSSSTALFKIIAGAKEAILAGIPSIKESEKADVYSEESIWQVGM
jgi:hypothetical protein